MTATSPPSSFVKPLDDNKNVSVTNDNANEDANALENDAEPKETKDGNEGKRRGLWSVSATGTVNAVKTA
jgi:hypothetical protein